MKLCFITCHYPPMARTYRRYGFARGLHEGGCDVEVVTHGNISHALGAFEDDDGLGTADSEFPVHRPKAIPWHLLGEILFRAGLVACPYRNWYGPAWRRGAKLVHSEADVVMGIYPPMTNLLAAHRVAEATGAKLVLDFRDEYLELTSGIQRRLAENVQSRLLKRADLISVATEVVKERFVQRDRFPAERIHVTENGYWQEADHDEYDTGERMRVVYVGAMSAIQGLGVLCGAVRIVRQARPELAQRLECVLYGPDTFYRQRVLQPLLVPGVAYGGYVDAPDVAGVLRSADVCFASLSSEKYDYAIPGKLYDYIAEARPILGSLPRGSASAMIEENDFGLVANCGSEADLAEKLIQMLSPARRRQIHQRLVAGRGRFAALPKVISLAQRIREL
jgi:glycosyltransferase involved in cell wall biosynthesis